MSKKQVCTSLSVSNENDNGEIDHINKKYIYRPRRRHRDKKENIACLGEAMSLCNKQHLKETRNSSKIRPLDFEKKR